MKIRLSNNEIYLIKRALSFNQAINDAVDSSFDERVNRTLKGLIIESICGHKISGESVIITDNDLQKAYDDPEYQIKVTCGHPVEPIKPFKF